MDTMNLGTMIELRARDGHRLTAYRSAPTAPTRGGVLMLQDAFGINRHLRAVCDDYAGHGYVAIAPALYDRQQRDAAFDYDEASLETARGLRRGLDYATALLDADTAIEALRKSGRVGVVGYCVGGSAAWLAACRLRVDAASCYYPSDIGKQVDEMPRCPVVMHFAERDRFIPAETVARFRAAHPSIPAHLYPAEHGFNCSALAHAFSGDSARLALDRTLELFTAHVA